MSKFILSHEGAVKFFEKHTHLDFNVMNGIFVNIMEKLIQNMSDNIESGHNTALIKQLANRLETMESSFTQHNAAVVRSIDKFNDQFSSLIGNHLESMLLNMRDTIKSNNGDAEKSILLRIQENNELFLSRVSSLVKDDTMRIFLEKEITKINTKVCEESERMLASFEKTDNEQSMEKINQMMMSQYKELDTTFKARIESFFSSQLIR